MKKKDSLGDRMKANYENVFKTRLPKRMPVIIRLDGKAFHTLTKKLGKPFDSGFMDWMNQTAKYLCDNIQGAQMAYVQSDEISILINNYKKLVSQSWFDNEVQKMASVSAGMASAFFSSLVTYSCSINEGLKKKLPTNTIVFDSRVVGLPKEEVANYFVWRQQDWTRNSVQMLCRSYYSHKECVNKNNSDMQDMIHKKGDNWDKLDTALKRGRCIVRRERLGRSTWRVDDDIPVFTKHRLYIEQHLAIDEEE